MINSIEKVFIIGATGAVGQALVKVLNTLEACKKIVVLVREQHLNYKLFKKVEQFVLTDFLLLNENDLNGYSHVFSCLGTTLKKAGSRAAFYATDYGINVHVAKLVAAQACQPQFLIVSSLGANPRSVFFYASVKGQIEHALMALNLDRLSIFRPSLLLIERQETRFAERAVQKLYQRYQHLIPSSFLHKPVTPEQVAYTMVDAAQNQKEKCEMYANLQIQKH